VKATIVLPRLETEITVFTVATWHKNLGEAVYAGDVLVTLQSGSQSQFPVHATQFGVLVKRCVLVGEAIETGEPLAVLSVPESPVSTLPTTVPAYAPQGPENQQRPQRLARHHTHALLNTPTVITQAVFDSTEVARLAAKTEGRTLPFVIAAVAANLRLFPVFNAQWLTENDVRLKYDVHIALAETVICHADTKSVAQIHREMITPEPARFSATFTLTEILAPEIVYQTPVLHLPQSAHLIVLRERLILAHDARVASEAEAVAFLGGVTQHLQNAAFLFV
jgi:pyruvate/2-oxoglutarate dehydrogenase complex dihydrolipoamide acyltransferase (E2) component